jgi:signal transduction histidine kinase
VTSTRSLRSRIFVGSLLWTLGLLAIAGAIAIAIVHTHPEWAGLAHSAMLFLVALACAGAGLSQFRRGMSNVDQLRVRLGEVRDGRARRVDGVYPSEVQPLVNDLNALLDDRERSVTRALAKAGDLAHGLKTPLAVLSQEAERAKAVGLADLSATVSQQVERMRRQIDYHLAQARAAASGPVAHVRCSVKESADGLSRTLLRLHADRGLEIRVDVAADHAVHSHREDLDEMLGNLLDNACKWAASCVAITSSLEHADVIVIVDDDGPGLAPSMREAVLQRGVRADQAAPGSGLGLAIVRDLAELYGGSITLDNSPEGGVRARLRLPAG